ncbi:MAG: hypothetical protein HOY79_20650 [Streptomyces sp.]|nr:hypothetical protein [Streptomyces sp.]
MPVEVRYLAGERPQKDVFPDADSVGVDDTACLVVVRNVDTKNEELVAVFAPGVWISGRMIDDAGAS